MQVSTDKDDNQHASTEADNDGQDCGNVVGDEKTEHDDKNRALPIDRGWAWAVFAGTALYMFVFGGVRKNFGIFFVAFQTQYHSSASLTSLLSTTQNIVLSVAGLFVMTVGLQVISNRASVMTGACLITASYAITAYSRDIGILFLSYGFIEGIGVAMVHSPIVAMLTEYFDKRRAIVNGLAFATASIGGLVFAPITSSLFEHNGYTATLMIVAGMVFHIVITGALLRPLNSFKRLNSSNTKTCNSEAGNLKKKVPLVNMNTEPTAKSNVVDPMVNINAADMTNNCENVGEVKPGQIINEAEDDQPIIVENITIPSHMAGPVKRRLKEYTSFKLSLRRTHSLDEGQSSNALSESPLLLRPRAWSTGKIRTIAHVSHKAGVNLLVVGSVGSMVQISKTLEHDNKSTNAVADGDKKTCCITLRQGVRKLSELFDINLFKLPVFRVFLLLAFFSNAGSRAVVVFLAPHANDIGLSSEQIGLLMSIVGGGELVSRLFVAVISDRNWVKRTTILSVAFISVGVAAHCARFYQSFPAMAFFAAVVVFKECFFFNAKKGYTTDVDELAFIMRSLNYSPTLEEVNSYFQKYVKGMSCGLYISLYAVIIVDYLGLEKLRSSMGFAMMCHGIAGASIYPLTGVIRDKTGSYVAAYHFLGSVMLAAASISIILPYIHTRQQKRLSQETKHEL